MFISESKNDDSVQNYWITSTDIYCTSPLEFYSAVEEALQKIKVPGLKIDRVAIAAGGLLSCDRIYLRLMRERLVFYICAAPFGARWFASCRLVHVPPAVKIWHVVVLLALGLVVFSCLTHLLDVLFLGVTVLSLMLAAILKFRHAVALGLQDVDALLLNIPAISQIYQLWFRKETYYRIDTRNLYLKTIPKVVRSVFDEVTGANGIKWVPRRYPPVKTIEQIIMETPKLSCNVKAISKTRISTGIKGSSDIPA